MTIRFDNQNRAQNEYVVDWLEVAWENAQSAVLLSGNPSLKKLALAHVQQSAETATKGIALRIGMSYEEVEKFRHDNLKLSGKILDKMMDEIHLKPFLGSIMPDDVARGILKALGTILRATDDLEFRRSMQLAPPSDVRKVLDLINSINSRLERDAHPGAERSVREIIGSFNVSELYDDNSEFVFPPGIASWLENRGIDADAFKDFLTVNLGNRFISLENDNRGESSDSDDMRHVPIEVVMGKLNAILKLVMAVIKVFLIGALAWPHYISARYPAPNAPPSPQEAAQLGKFGAQHYTDEIGVIQYVRELSQTLLEAVETLNDLYLKHL